MRPTHRLHINGHATEPSLRVQVTGGSRLTVAANGGVSIGGLQDSPPDDGLFVKGDVGIGTATPFGNLEIRQLTDSEDDADLDNFGVVIRNNQNDTGKEVGMGFRISSDPDFPPGPPSLTSAREPTASGSCISKPAPLPAC